jgi:hypothetical protein
MKARWPVLFTLALIGCGGPATDDGSDDLGRSGRALNENQGGGGAWGATTGVGGSPPGAGGAGGDPCQDERDALDTAMVDWDCCMATVDLEQCAGLEGEACDACVYGQCNDFWFTVMLARNALKQCDDEVLFIDPDLHYVCPPRVLKPKWD